MTEDKTLEKEPIENDVQEDENQTERDEVVMKDFQNMMGEMMSMFGDMDMDKMAEGMESMKPSISFEKINPEAKLPTYGSEFSSGFDIYTPVAFSIKANESKTINTGLKIANIPDGIEIQVRPRSGLAANDMISVLNTPGTIDQDYRGELKVILINHSKKTKLFKKYDRICQCVAAPVYRLNLKWAEEDDKTETKRGDGGIGSTGS